MAGVRGALPMAIADAAIVCRCEEVTAARSAAEIAVGPDVAAGAEESHAGRNGPLPGSFLCRDDRPNVSRRPEPDGFAAPRAPLRPVPAAPLMREAPEFVAPLLSDPAAAGPPACAAALADRDAARGCGGDRRRRGRAFDGVFPGERRRRCAADRSRRGRHGRQHRQRRQPACPVAVLRFQRRHAGGWRTGRAYPAARPAQHRAVEGRSAQRWARISASAPKAV